MEIEHVYRSFMVNNGVEPGINDNMSLIKHNKYTSDNELIHITTKVSNA